MKHFLSRFFPQRIKNFLHASEAVLSSWYFNHPAEKLVIIGVTGTNGKTTTCQLIASILEEDGKKVALATTINFRISGREKINASKFTTLSGRKLQRFLKEAVDAGCTHAVLEVSSHALDQGRVRNISYEVAVITNVTREHLDYHKTMEGYRRAKRRLFQKAKKSVVNLDMWEPDFFLKGDAEEWTYSTVKDTADLFAHSITTSLEGSSFVVSQVSFRLQLPGVFNIENALAAIGAASAVGVTLETAARGIEKVTLVQGRMDRVENPLGADIFIDYAVTPDALEKLYALVSSARKAPSKIIAVFGACGDRDRGKRPIMGKIVSSHADIIILTNEDPYYEDPEQILDEIEKGISGKKKDLSLFRILDRREAIRKALSLLRPGDTLLLTGKGAEETLAIGEERLPWNDRSVIEEELRKLQG